MRLPRSLSPLLACLLAAPIWAAGEPPLETDEQKTLYAIGRALAQRLGGFEFSSEDAETIGAGVRDGLLGRAPRVPIAEFEPRMNDLLRDRMARMAEREKQAGLEFLARAAGEPGAVKTDSGLVYFEIEPGTGESPSPDATVELRYTGKLTDGTVFGTTEGVAPATFALTGVVPCFSEGLRRMRTGGKSKLVCPPDLAYGAEGRPPLIYPGATLIFEIELVATRPTPQAAPKPESPVP